MVKQKNRLGRPPKIDEQKLLAFKTFIIAGCTLKEACEQIEITTQTWRNFTKKHPIYLAKYAKWRKELETRAKLNIAVQITNKKNPDYSTYYLDYLMKLKDNAARTALNRANAKKVKAQTELMKKQLEEVENVADKSSDKMAQLDTKTLIKLSRLADGSGNDDFNAE